MFKDHKKRENVSMEMETESTFEETTFSVQEIENGYNFRNVLRLISWKVATFGNVLDFYFCL